MGRNSLKRGIWLLGRSNWTWYVSIQPGPWREERQNNGNSYNETKWLLSTKVTADVLDWQKVNKSRWELVWWGGLGTDVPGEIFPDKTCRCREKQIPFNWPQVFDPKPPRQSSEIGLKSSEKEMHWSLGHPQCTRSGNTIKWKSATGKSSPQEKQNTGYSLVLF